MTLQVEPFDAHMVSEQVLRGVDAVLAANDAEELPDDQPTPFEQRVLMLKAAPPSHVEMARWIVMEGREVVGYSFCQVWPEEDPDNAFILTMVPPEHRRRGIGRMAFSAAVDKIHDEGRGKMIVDCVAGYPWETALERLGLKRSLTEKQSRLVMSDLDLGLMDTWIEKSQERAGDYELLFMELPVPEEHLEEFARVRNAINDEPNEDLEFERGLMTPQRWRSQERYLAEKGERTLVYIAVHRPSGAFGGVTVVNLQLHHKTVAYQGDTAVLAAHRNLGLGRLLKAAMIRKIVEEHPEVAMVDTHNAGSNAAMLGINVEMGFKPILMYSAWQGPTDVVHANLSR